MLLSILIATGIVSAISAGAVLFLTRVYQKRVSMQRLVAIASGVLLATVFLELFPEVVENPFFSPLPFFSTVLASVLGFYGIEQVIHWHHCRGVHCPKKTHVVVNNLVGDGVHNFVDGILIGSAFLVSPAVGIATTIAVAAHEIPQELSDASILLYAGLSRTRVLVLNILFSLTAIGGAVAAYFFLQSIASLVPYFIAIAAGNFLYLALADLIPALHTERKRSEIVSHTLWLGAGVAVIGILSVFAG